MIQITNPPHDEEGRGAKPVVIIILLLLALAGAGLYVLSVAPDAEPESEPVEAEAGPPPEPVESGPEPAPTPDLPSTGELYVSANVDGASVFIDGEPAGSAPFENADIAIGRYEVKVTRSGYQDFVDNVRVRPGRRAELRARLERAPPSLRVVSDVPGAMVFLDRDYVGETPVRIDAVEPGEHELTVSADGFDMYAETIRVTEGHRDVDVQFEAAARTLDERVGVVHKHTFGSCEGVLIADQNGIRYETDNQNDAFRANFEALERLEVDYMDKNLNVKIRGGRNYNFTEPSGDADALFVFHQNIESYREGL